MFLVIQCAHIISPKRKDHYLEKKVLPTINIICPASIKVVHLNAFNFRPGLCFDKFVKPMDVNSI